jgi:hypothetical protein
LEATRYYILVGDETNWKIAIIRRTWGFSINTKGLWNTSQIGDLLAFYVTLPIKKVIGFGRITTKDINEELIFSDEKILNKPIWKYKIEFEILSSTDIFENGISIPKNIMLNHGRVVINKNLFLELVKEAENKWHTNIKTSKY